MFQIERRPGIIGRLALALRGGAARRQISARAEGGTDLGGGGPPSASWIDHDDGLAQGCWPDDPDQTPGWVHALEARCRETGLQIPIYRSRREFDAAVARCLAAVNEATAEFDEPAEREMEPALGSHDAAVNFVRWLLRSGAPVELTSDQLTETYFGWCATQNRMAAPENLVRAAMKQLPGVSNRQQSRGRAGAQRIRPTVWHFVPTSKTSVSRSVSELRRAA